MNNLADELEKIFYKYRESFGIETELDAQCAFEQEFIEAICKHKGHILIPDQCAMPRHDFCVACGARREEIESGVISDCYGNTKKVERNFSKYIAVDCREPPK